LTVWTTFLSIGLFYYNRAANRCFEAAGDQHGRGFCSSIRVPIQGIAGRLIASDFARSSYSTAARSATPPASSRASRYGSVLIPPRKPNQTAPYAALMSLPGAGADNTDQQAFDSQASRERYAPIPSPSSRAPSLSTWHPWPSSPPRSARAPRETAPCDPQSGQTRAPRNEACAVRELIPSSHGASVAW